MRLELMSLGFDCSTGYIFHKDMNVHKGIEELHYHTGLFDWAVTKTPKVMQYLTKDFTSYLCNNNLFSVSTTGNPLNRNHEICMYTKDIEYIHVEEKETLQETVEAYEKRLLYLQEKTLNYYEKGKPFVVNLSDYHFRYTPPPPTVEDFVRCNKDLLKNNLVFVILNEHQQEAKVPKNFKKIIIPNYASAYDVDSFTYVDFNFKIEALIYKQIRQKFKEATNGNK